MAEEAEFDETLEYFRIAEIWEESLKIVDNYAGHLSTPLFHYCDLSGLKGILESKTFWATHSKYLNDATEITYGRELIIKKIKEFRDQEKNEDVYKILDNILIRATTQFFEEIEINFLQGRDVYIISFSEMGDQLSQWRGYGLDGKGFSLGIDPKLISTSSHKHFVVGKLKRPRLIKIQYDPLIQNRIVDEILGAILDKIRFLFKCLKQQPEKYKALINNVFPDVQIFESQAASVIQYNLEELILHFKDPSFREEKEWRAIVLHDGVFTNTVADLNLRTSGANLIPYLTVDFRSKNDGQLIPVKEIYLGPKRNYSTTALSLKALLYQIGYKNEILPKINKSNIPYI